jgi:prepilin-type processing-associated H-X9-DG protein
MLLPALGKARERVYGTQCVGNLRQQCFAVEMMCDDSDGIYPYSAISTTFRDSTANIHDWPNGNTHASILYNAGYLTNLEVFSCPQTGRLGTICGSSESTSGETGKALRAHVANSKVMNHCGTGGVWKTLFRRSVISNPSSKSLLLEGTSHLGSSIILYGTILGGDAYYRISPTYESGTRRPAKRHHGSASVGFVDGHVELRNDTDTNLDIY